MKKDDPSLKKNNIPYLKEAEKGELRGYLPELVTYNASCQCMGFYTSQA